MEAQVRTTYLLIAVRSQQNMAQWKLNKMVFDGEDGQHKMDDLRKAIKKLKVDKKYEEGLIITFLFTQHV